MYTEGRRTIPTRTCKATVGRVWNAELGSWNAKVLTSNCSPSRPMDGWRRRSVRRRPGQRQVLRPSDDVERRSGSVSSTIMRCMRCSKRSEPNGSRPDRRVDGSGTPSLDTSLKRVAAGSGRGAGERDICDLRIELHWQRNLGSRVMMPGTAGPHTYALRRKAYYVRRDAQTPRATVASGVLTAQRRRRLRRSTRHMSAC
jgi:hypothetical protein